MAFAALTSGRPGPVHIEIPTDVMPLPCPDLLPVRLPVGPVKPDPEQLAEAARLLNAAKRPVILAGGGVRRAQEAVRSEADRRAPPAGGETASRAHDQRPSPRSSNSASMASPSAGYSSG
jgi:acetolactate synthase-1/2/3 large subunit